MFVENPKESEFSQGFQFLSPQPASRFKRWLASMINGVLYGLCQ
ncbi:Uncharacterised protein [Rodentibacter pneumotropicus]|uniref:Uncharacterized protein n=1 Tax=Rodentibacter pneumotropicus TaxID=758 RepID=A0A448MP13_9PAST|nr:Uncharacterised protein [Rodentibacter pneumotropicus]